MKCKKCEHELPERLEFCPRCGASCELHDDEDSIANRTEYVIDVGQQHGKKRFTAIVIALALIFILINVGLLCFDSAKLESNAIKNDKDIKNSYTVKELLNSASSLEAQRVEEIAVELKSDMTIEDLARLVPYLSQEYIDDFVKSKIDTIDVMSDVAYIAPYVGSDVLDMIAKKVYKEKGLMEIAAIAPYLSQSIIDDCALEVYSDTHKLQDIACISHYVSKSVSNEIAKDAIKSYDKQAIKIILPLTDPKYLE